MNESIGLKITQKMKKWLLMREDWNLDPPRTVGKQTSHGSHLKSQH